MTETETTEGVYADLTSTTATSLAGPDLTNLWGLILAGAGFEIRGPDQGLNVLNSARGRNYLACKLVEKSRQFGATIVGIPRTARDLASKVTKIEITYQPLSHLANRNGGMY